MSDLEELRKKRMQQLMAQQQSSQGDEMQRQMQEQEVEKQIKVIITQILTPEARSRLGNIRVANPQMARNVEVLLIQLHQAGKLPRQLDDGAFKELLKKVTGKKRETRITKM